MLPGVGIFGTGPLAQTIVQYLKECGFSITAVWSRTLKEAESFSTELDIPFHTNKVDDLLLKTEVGFVVILCTPHLQSPIAVKALGIGKHVIASWPAGTSQLEVLKMVKAASYYPSLLSMMCHGLRFLPSYTKMKESIDSGLIGELFLFEIKIHNGVKMKEYGWQCDGMMGGGALSMHGSYIIDVVSYLSGRQVRSVSGMMKTFVDRTDKVNGVRQITCDDFCSFQLELEDNISVSCVINNLCQDETSHEIVTVGSKGRLIARGMNLIAKLDEYTEKEAMLHKEEYDEHNQIPLDDSSRVPFAMGFKKALKGVATAFQGVKDIHGWDATLLPSRATFDDALHVQTVIDAIRKSSQSKEWINIKILEEEPDPNPHLSSVVRRSAYNAF